MTPEEQANVAAAASHAEWVASEDSCVATQSFFAELAAQASKPHAGEHFKVFVSSILTRATEKGLYKP